MVADRSLVAVEALRQVRNAVRDRVPRDPVRPFDGKLGAVDRDGRNKEGRPILARCHWTLAATRRRRCRRSDCLSGSGASRSPGTREAEAKRQARRILLEWPSVLPRPVPERRDREHRGRSEHQPGRGHLTVAGGACVRPALPPAAAVKHRARSRSGRREAEPSAARRKRRQVHSERLRACIGCSRTVARPCRTTLVRLPAHERTPLRSGACVSCGGHGSRSGRESFHATRSRGTSASEPAGSMGSDPPLRPSASQAGSDPRRTGVDPPDPIWRRRSSRMSTRIDPPERPVEDDDWFATVQEAAVEIDQRSCAGPDPLRAARLRRRLASAAARPRSCSRFWWPSSW